MKVAVSGASGLIGCALVPALETACHEVVRRVRHEPHAPDAIEWDPDAGTIDARGLSGVDAIVTLSGENLGRRWSRKRTAEILTEESALGDGSLGEVGKAREDAAEPARVAGIRVVDFRQGIVLSRSGGARERMLTPCKLGVSRQVGSGRQWWACVALDDLVAACRFVLENELAGPVDVTSPNPATNQQS